MSKHKIAPKNIKNKKIIEEFIKLTKQIKYDMDHATLNEKIKHSYRLMQINKIINILKKYPRKIKYGEQIKDIKGVGIGTTNRINEIIKRGHLKEIKLKSKYKKYLKKFA